MYAQDIVEHINMANEFEDRMIANNQKPDPALNMYENAIPLLCSLLQLPILRSVICPARSGCPRTSFS